ncbi:hypothetical protein R3P38DRAFT_3206598 [Favolaschia claudopus]|uniref:Uncharacterized protein n=1 Tax=Favolaschia claudopus TaxID=2862362 RepID=A0AAW0ANN4_9AGAR
MDKREFIEQHSPRARPDPADHDADIPATTRVFSDVDLLCKHPDVQRQLRAELLTNLPACPPSPEANLSYLSAVMYEILRCSPTAAAVTRDTTRDTVLLGYPIPKGTQALMPIEMVQQMESFINAKLATILRDGNAAVAGCQGNSRSRSTSSHPTPTTTRLTSRTPPSITPTPPPLLSLLPKYVTLRRCVVMSKTTSTPLSIVPQPSHRPTRHPTHHHPPPTRHFAPSAPALAFPPPPPPLRTSSPRTLRNDEPIRGCLKDVSAALAGVQTFTHDLPALHLNHPHPRCPQLHLGLRRRRGKSSTLLFLTAAVA